MSSLDYKVGCIHLEDDSPFNRLYEPEMRIEVPAKCAIEILPQNGRTSKSTQTVLPLPDELSRWRELVWPDRKPTNDNESVLTSLPIMTHSRCNNDDVTSASYHPVKESTDQLSKRNGMTSFAIEKYRLNKDQGSLGGQTTDANREYSEIAAIVRPTQLEILQVPMEINPNLENMCMTHHQRTSTSNRKWDPQKPEVRRTPRMGTRMCHERFCSQQRLNPAGKSGKLQTLEESSRLIHNSHDENDLDSLEVDTSTSSAYNTGGSTSSPAGKSFSSELEDRSTTSKTTTTSEKSGAKMLFPAKIFTEKSVFQDDCSPEIDSIRLAICQVEKKIADGKSGKNISSGIFPDSNFRTKDSDLFIAETLAANQNRCRYHVTAADDFERSTKVRPPVDVMYTNRTNLDHTMMVQQSLYQAQHHLPLGARCQEWPGATGQTHQVEKGQVQSQIKDSAEEEQRKWVVKIRPDGTKYITKVPLNSTNNRRQRRRTRRNVDLTSSDEDSDVKLGRHWSREERRKHAEASKLRHQNKEILYKRSTMADVTPPTVSASTKMADKQKPDVPVRVSNLHEIISDKNENINSRQQDNRGNNNKNKNNNNSNISNNYTLLSVTTI